MVIHNLVWLRVSILLAQTAKEPLIKQLDPERNVALMMALLGLVLIGITLVACIMVGGHWVRRLARSQPSQKTMTKKNGEAWRGTVAKMLSAEMLEGKANETMAVDQATDDTRTD